MLDFGFKSDRGRVRVNNQDSFFIMPNENIFIVADGVGGHTSGELASRTAVSRIAEVLRDNPVEEGDDDDTVKAKIIKALMVVNEQLYDMACDQETLGMATTLLLLCVANGNAYVVNVGDSRAYLIRNGGIIQLTEDHTYVNDLVKRGILTPEQAQNHPDRNMITRAMGAEERVRPDFFRFGVETGDVVLMCTDGLYNELEVEELRNVLETEPGMREACAKLVQLANSRGGRDNITALAVKI